MVDEGVPFHELLGRFAGGEDGHSALGARVGEGADHEQQAALAEAHEPGLVGREVRTCQGRDVVA